MSVTMPLEGATGNQPDGELPVQNSLDHSDLSSAVRPDTLPIARVLSPGAHESPAGRAQTAHILSPIYRNLLAKRKKSVPRPSPCETISSAS